MKPLLITFFITLSSILYSQDTLKWSTSDYYFNANSTLVIPIRVQNFDSIFAFQYGLKFDTTFLELDSVSFTGILPGYDLEGFGFSWIPPNLIPKNNISTLWTDAYGYSLPDNSVVYNLHLTSKKYGQLKNVLFPSKEILVFEAIDETFEEIAITFEVISELPLNEPTLKSDDVINNCIRIYPTPIINYFNVELPSAGTIVIFDIIGNVERVLNANVGLNIIELCGYSGIKILYFFNGKDQFSMKIIKE